MSEARAAGRKANNSPKAVFIKVEGGWLKKAEGKVGKEEGKK